MPAWLPSKGLLREHHDYATWCTDAPPIYHVAAMVTAMAAVCADQARLVVDNHIYPLHTWAMIVGRSTIDRKTTSTRLAVTRVERVMANRVHRIYGSPEGILQGLAATPCICLYVPEGGAFFAQREASYWKHARDIFMDLYDYTEVFERRLVKDVLTVNNPRISILSACAYPLLARYTRDTDWLGGFLARFLMIAGEPLEFMKRPRSDHVKEGRIEGLLENIFHTNWGTLGMTSGAQKVLDEFSAEIHKDLDAYPEGLHPSLNRLPETANRIAALYEIATQAVNPPETGRITLVTTESALGAAGLCRASRDHALTQLADLTVGQGPSRDLLRIETMIRKSGIAGVPRSVILRNAPIRARQLDDILTTLAQAELVRSKISERNKRTVERYVHTEAEKDAERQARNAEAFPETPPTWVDWSEDVEPQLDKLEVFGEPPPWATYINDDDKPN